MELTEFNAQMKNVKNMTQEEQTKFINEVFYSAIQYVGVASFTNNFKYFSEKSKELIYFKIGFTFKDIYSNNFYTLTSKTRFFVFVKNTEEFDIDAVFSTLSLEDLSIISKTPSIYNKIKKYARLYLSFLNSIFNRINDDDELLQVFKQSNVFVQQYILDEFDKNFVEKDKKLSFLIIRRFAYLLRDVNDVVGIGYDYPYYTYYAKMLEARREFRQTIQNEFMYNKMKKYYTHYSRRFKDFISVWLTYKCFILEDEEMYEEFIRKLRQFGMNETISTYYFERLSKEDFLKEKDKPILDSLLMYRKIKGVR
jgi:hypothetical protein